MASILAFQQPQRSSNWSNEELAELFRVVDILGRAGVAIDTDMGLSDEGEPWFAFCRADTGDVIVHFSRIDGQFVAVSAATDAVVRGNNFRRVAEALVNRQPLILPAPSSGQKLFLHPSVILTALVATTLAQMKSWEGQDIVAFDEGDDAAASGLSEASFSEILKTAFMDALNLVLRGFTGAMDAKHMLAENVQPLGLSLGNLSLASVVAFAISVIQGAPQRDDMELASLSAQDSGTQGDDTGAAIMAIIPVAADTESQIDAGGQERGLANDEAAPDKGAPVKAAPPQRDVASLEKTGAAEDRSDAMAAGENSAQPSHRELAVTLASSETRPDDAQQKIDVAVIRTETAKAAPAAQVAVTERGDAQAVMNVQFTPGKAQHQFTYAEITKEALEIFFGNGVTASGDRGGFTIAGESGADGALGVAGKLVFGGENATFQSPGMKLPDAGGDMALALPARPALNASDIVFAAGDPAVLARLNLITDFVNSAENKIDQTQDLGNILKPFWGGDRAFTVVVFDSQNLPLNIFSFTSNVLFVEESQLTGTSIDFGDRSLQLDLASGGDVTLLGVINLTPYMAA